MSILGGMFVLNGMFRSQESLPSRNCFQSLYPRTRRLMPLCSLAVSCSLALWAFRGPDCKRGEHLLFYYVIMGTDVYIKLLLFLTLSSTRWFRPWILLFVTVPIYLSSSPLCTWLWIVLTWRTCLPESELSKLLGLYHLQFDHIEYSGKRMFLVFNVQCSMKHFLIILLNIYYFFFSGGGKVNQK